jgi:hypothetical protein
MSVLGLVIASPSFGWATETSDDKWRSGWGQGWAEAQVTHGSGNEIYVACEAGSEENSFIRFTLVGSGPRAREILVIFDNGHPASIETGPDGTITQDSNAGDSTFRYLLQAFKQRNNVYVRFPDGRESTFTLKGAAAALGGC